MKCPKCGQENGDSKRCGTCGASMAATTRLAKPTSPAAAVSEQPIQAESAPGAVAPGKQIVIPLPSFAAHRRTLALVGGGVALVILLVVLLMAGGSATFDGTSAITMKTSTQDVLKSRTEDEKKAYYGMETKLRVTLSLAGSSGRPGDLRGDFDRGGELVRVFAHGKTYEQFMEQAPKAMDQVNQNSKR